MYSLYENIKFPKHWFPPFEFKNELEIRDRYFKRYCELGFYSESNNRDKVMNATCCSIANYFYPFVKNEIEFSLGYDIMGAFFIIDDVFDGNEINYTNKLKYERLYSIINNYGDINSSLSAISLNFDPKLSQSEKFLSKYIKDSYEYCKNSNSKKLIYFKIVQGWLQYIESLHSYNLLQRNELYQNQNQLFNNEIQMFIRRFNIAYFPASDLGVMMEIDDEFEDPLIIYHPKYYLMHSNCTLSMSLANDLQSFEKELLENQYQNNYLYKLIANNRDNNNNDQSSVINSLDKGIKQIFKELQEKNDYAERLEQELLDEYKSKLNETQINKFKNILTSGLVINGGGLIWGINCTRYTTKNSIFIEMKKKYEENCTNYSNNENALNVLKSIFLKQTK